MTHVIDPQEAGIHRSSDLCCLVLLQRGEVELGSRHEGLVGRGEPSDLGNDRVDTGSARLLGLEGSRAKVAVGVGSLEHRHVDHPGWVGRAEAGAASGLEDQRGVEGGDGDLEVDDAAADSCASNGDSPLESDVVQACVGATCQVKLVSKQVAASDDGALTRPIRTNSPVAICDAVAFNLGGGNGSGSAGQGSEEDRGKHCCWCLSTGNEASVRLAAAAKCWKG